MFKNNPDYTFPTRIYKIRPENGHLESIYLSYTEDFYIFASDVIKMWNQVSVEERLEILNNPSIKNPNATVSKRAFDCERVTIESTVIQIDGFMKYWNGLPKETRREIINKNQELFNTVY